MAERIHQRAMVHELGDGASYSGCGGRPEGLPGQKDECRMVGGYFRHAGCTLSGNIVSCAHRRICAPDEVDAPGCRHWRDHPCCIRELPGSEEGCVCYGGGGFC